MKILTRICLLSALGAALPAYSANFAVVGLGFEGTQVPDATGTYEPAQVWQFYGGGYSRSADGSTDLVLGPADYGVVFSDSALALRSTAANGISNFAQRFLDTQSGTPLNNLGVTALFYDGDAPVLNYASGFGVGFSFYYASNGGNHRHAVRRLRRHRHAAGQRQLPPHADLHAGRQQLLCLVGRGDLVQRSGALGALRRPAEPGAVRQRHLRLAHADRRRDPGAGALDLRDGRARTAARRCGRAPSARRLNRRGAAGQRAAAAPSSARCSRHISA